MSEEKSESEQNQFHKIGLEGSLGLLANGDLGLRAWRKVKNENKSKIDSSEKQ